MHASAADAPVQRAQQWIDDPEFDLAHHVRRVAIARPGDDTELSQAIAHALERPLDLDRPLWECWVIEGLKGNRWAILMKIHHCLADGISAAHLLTRLCDDADGDTFANRVEQRTRFPQPPAQKRSWADTLWRAPRRRRRRHPAPLGRGDLAGDADVADRPGHHHAAVPARCESPSPTSTASAAKFGVTTNDVALAAITEGFRTVLLHRGEQPRAGLAAHPGADAGVAISVMLPYLPVEHDDPVQRLRTVHSRLNRPSRPTSRKPAASWTRQSTLPIHVVASS